METLGRALRARKAEEFENERVAAEAELVEAFPAGTWGVKAAAEPYSPENVKNLWQNELSRPVRTALEEAGANEQGFGEWLGGVHYAYFSIYLKSLFDHYQDNRGWRITIISLPALGIGAAGIASHYQKAQNHNRLAEVSNLLYEHAEGGLKKHDVGLPGRKVERADWDGIGLLPSPVAEICGVEVPGGATVKFIRTTTVKKIIASFVCIQPFDLQRVGDGDEFRQLLKGLESAGRALA